MGDVEDPELYAALPIGEWQNTEHGAWCMDHGDNIAWYLEENFGYWGYRIRIEGNLNEQDLTYFYIRWGETS